MKKLQVTTLLICLFVFTAINLNAQTQGAGYALDFDGSTDYVDCGTNSSLDITSDKSVTAWINPSSTVGMKLIIGKYNRFTTKQQWRFYLDGDKLMIDHFTSNGNFIRIQSINSIYANNWVHVSAVYKESGYIQQLYINGEEVPFTNHSSGTYTGIKNTLYNTEIGRLIGGSNNPAWFFEGSLDEICIWNRALTETEIRNNMNKPLTGNEPGLVAYYQMNEGEDGTCEQGKDVCDKSGKGNHGEKK